jgi:hypothetical protein
MLRRQGGGSRTTSLCGYVEPGVGEAPVPLHAQGVWKKFWTLFGNGSQAMYGLRDGLGQRVILHFSGTRVAADAEVVTKRCLRFRHRVETSVALSVNAAIL